MVSVTYYFYFASALVIVGLVGLLVRRQALIAMFCTQIILLAIQVLFVALARLHGQNHGQLLAMMVSVMAMVHLAIGGWMIWRQTQA